MDHGCPCCRVIVTPLNTEDSMNNNSNALTIQPRQTSMEVAASSSAALAKATIEAKFAIAYKNPRNVEAATERILAACKRPKFAERAIYSKPGAKLLNKSTGQWEQTFYRGKSIRFAETAIGAWGNVDVSAVTAWEDEEKRLIRITVTDLETNLSYTDEVMVDKIVERKKLKEGQESIGTRKNQNGDTVFLVRATEDELKNKVNAAKSFSIRNSGLRLIPSDIQEDAEEAIKATNAAATQDRAATGRKVADSFNTLGITTRDIEQFLGHKVSECNAEELENLRGIYSAIQDGEAKWSDYMPEKTVDKGSHVDAATMFKNATPPPAAPQNTPPAPPPAEQSTTVSKTVIGPDGHPQYTGPSKPKRSPRAAKPEPTDASNPTHPPTLVGLCRDNKIDFPGLCEAAANCGLGGLDQLATSIEEIPDDIASAVIAQWPEILKANGGVL